MAATFSYLLMLYSADFNPIDTNDILDTHKYLMKIIWYEIMFGLIEKTFSGILTIIQSAFLYAITNV